MAIGGCSLSVSSREWVRRGGMLSQSGFATCGKRRYLKGLFEIPKAWKAHRSDQDQWGLGVGYRVYRVAVDNGPITLGESTTEQSHCISRPLAGLGDIDVSSNTMALFNMLGVARERSLCSLPPSVYWPTYWIMEQWRLCNQRKGEFANLQGLSTISLGGDSLLCW